MALKQTRRTVSLNRGAYDALAKAALDLDVSHSKLVIDALRAYGIEIPEETKHVAPSTIRYARLMRSQSGKRKVTSGQRVVGMIRAFIGDPIADALGEP